MRARMRWLAEDNDPDTRMLIELAEISAAETTAEPITVEPSSSCTTSLTDAPPVAKDTENLG